jgi:rfaE bifunctional protein nucleotidyltransferase chain/domain
MDNPKFITRSEATALCLKFHSFGKRIVFTNGCFDVIHAGHVYLLNEAKKLGDVLLLGLNDDDGVRKLKGAGRPRFPLELRAYTMAGLSSVDYVVAFSEDTPLELIKALRPDVLVKGGDYTTETIVGAKEVASWGGKVIVIPLIEGLSTTNTLNIS